MIHEDEDEIDNEPINFSWIYYTGSAKLNLSLKEVGRLTYRQFMNMLQAYRDTFDLELYLFLGRTTYKKLQDQAEKSEEWLT